MSMPSLVAMLPIFIEAQANGKGASSLKKRVNVLKMLLLFHDVEVSDNKLKTKLKLPRTIRRHKEPIDRQDIREILQACEDIRVKTYIMLLAGTGMRAREALALRFQDFDITADPPRINIPGDITKTRTEYLTFLTPQTSALMARLVKKAKGDHVFFNYHNATTAAGKGAHIMAVWRVLVRTGLRKPTERQDRKETMLNHSLRQHYRTVLENAGIKEEHAEKLMDHGPKLVRTYAKPTPEQWLETSQYMQAVPQLTFSF